MTELSGEPNQPLKSEHAFYHSMEELIPLFERYRLQLKSKPTRTTSPSATTTRCRSSAG